MGSANHSDPEEKVTPTSFRSGGDEGDTGQFASYLASLRTTTVEVPRIRTLDLVGVIVASLVALGSVFGPWIRYISLRLTVEYVPGYKTDGIFLIACSLVSLGAMLIAWRRGPGHGDIEAITSLVASVLGIITVSATVMYLDGYLIDDASGREQTRAAWALYLAGISSAVAAVFSFRAMRSAQI